MNIMLRAIYSFTGAIVLALGLLILPSVALATNYYVDQENGTNSNGGQKPGDAFATLDYAMRTLQAGDTLYVRAGIYEDVPLLTSRYYNSGTLANPITVKAYESEKAHIKANRNLLVKDVAGWVFEGLTFENSDTVRIGDQKSGNCTSFAEQIVFRNNRFQHGKEIGINVQCGRDILIEDNIFDNLRSRTVGVSLNAVQLSNTVENISITGNTFRDIGGDGLYIIGSVQDLEISSNTFEVIRPYSYRDETGKVDSANPTRFGNVGSNAIELKSTPGGDIEITGNIIRGFYPAASGQDVKRSLGIGLQILNDVSGITLRKNYFYNNVFHVRIGKGFSSSPLPERDTMISNNIFGELAQESGADPIALRIWSASGIQVLNNTFYASGSSLEALLNVKDVQAMELQNNLFVKGSIQALTKSSYILDIYADHNAWFNPANEIDSALKGSHDLYLDSVDLDSLWVPAASSPLVDAGAYLGITDDFYGAPITGSAPDIGAVESGLESGASDDQVVETELTQMQESAVQFSSNTDGPVVSIIAPGATVSGTVQIVVEASDPDGIERVKLYVNDVHLGGDLTAPYVFSWDSSYYAGQEVQIKALARNNSGEKTTTEITLAVSSNDPAETETVNTVEQTWDEEILTAALAGTTVSDDQLPFVEIISPTSYASGIAEVVVQAIDADGIDRVKLYIDDVLLGGDLTSPYTFKWDTSAYTGKDVKVKAMARDKLGNRNFHEIVLTVSGSSQTVAEEEVIQEEEVIVEAPVTTPVVDSNLPLVSIVAPTTISSGVMKIVVEASDPDGVDRVKLYVDDVHLGGDLTAPYTFTWDSSSYSGRDVRITAMARDNNGNKATDEIVLAIPASGTTPVVVETSVAETSTSASQDTAVSATEEESQVAKTGSTSSSTASGAELLFVGDFESGKIQSQYNAWDGWTKEEQGLSGAIGVQSSVVRTGKYAGKFYLEKADWDGTNSTQGNGKPRAELMKNVNALPIKFDTEYWMGVSVYIPSNWQEDSNESNAEIVWQFHATGEVGPYVPPLALRIKGGNIALVNHTGNVKDKIQARELWSGKLEKGKWVDWVVRVKFSLENGYIQAWKSGTKVADFSGGATVFYDGDAPRRDPLYFKMGLYKSKYGKLYSSTVNRTIYMDELRIAKGGSAGKSLVTPGASQ